MGSHSVTCHPTEVRIPPLPPAEAGTQFSDPGGMQGWVDLCYVNTTGRELNPRPVNLKSNALPLSHHATHSITVFLIRHIIVGHFLIPCIPNSVSVPGSLPASLKTNVTLTHLLPVANAARSLLSVTTRKLVTDLRCFHRSHTDLAELVALLVDSHHHLQQD